jgi:hypothetical protein
VDLLWWPGFNRIGAAYVDTIPVSAVATEVQCEIYSFLKEEQKINEQTRKTPLLDPAKGATVSLTLQTDLSGLQWPPRCATGANKSDARTLKTR